MDSISRKLLNGVGFSKGCELFALKNPPPFVPNCLIAICEAAGPIGIICCVPCKCLNSFIRFEILNNTLTNQYNGKQ